MRRPSHHRRKSAHGPPPPDPNLDTLGHIGGGAYLAEGWEQAYAGFMPAAVLAPRIDPAFRHRELEHWLATEFDFTGETLLVGERQGDVIGFVVARLGDKEDWALWRISRSSTWRAGLRTRASAGACCVPPQTGSRPGRLGRS
jgi:hypothetical protein